MILKEIKTTHHVARMQYVLIEPVSRLILHVSLQEMYNQEECA